MTRIRSTFIAIATVLLMGAIAGWVLLNRAYILDQIVVWQYQPTEKIAQLARDSSMSSTGTFYFYAARPELHEEQSAFNAACPRQEKASAILGCYASGVIHVYDVPDERLEAVPAVTAAHEMLHSAWDRLSMNEREYVGGLLQAEYDKLKNSGTSDLESRMQYYVRTAPDHLDNELHSIIATEVADISDELEVHYATYFDNRRQVVELYESYNDRFVELNQTADMLRQELEQLSAEIAYMTDRYNSSIDALNNDITTFNSRANSGYYDSEASFARDRGLLTSRVDELDAMRSEIDAKAQEYEAKRLVYNEQVDESNSLLKSLDSTLAPAPSI